MKNKLIYILLGLALVLVIGNLGLSIYLSQNLSDNVSTIINAIVIFGISSLVIGASFLMIKQANHDNRLIAIINIALAVLLVGNAVVMTQAVELPKQAVVPNFVNEPISTVSEWAEKHEIEVIENRVYSDKIAEYHVVGQSVAANTLAKDVKSIEVSVSVGPNLDELLTVTNLVGMSYDEVNDYLNEIMFTNVNFEFEVNEDIARDIVISQNLTGEIKRRDTLELVLSLGPEGSLEPVASIDFANMTLQEAINWLKRYGIKHEVEYAFSDEVERGKIISQSIQKDEMINPYENTIVFTVSKGVEVVIPNLKAMTKDEIIRFAIDNKVEVEFSSKYDAAIAEDAVISANYNEGDKVEQGTTLEVVLSKGQLKMLDFGSYAEFKNWASANGVHYNEVYEYNDNVPNGGVISYSISPGTVISNNENITVKLSKGKAISVPDFSGKTHSQAQSMCSSAGLSCTFSYAGYNSAAKDTVLSQSVGVGTTVTSGTRVTISLSSGPAQAFTVVMQESWLTPGSADGTISTLRSRFASAYPGVNFNFVKKAHSTLNPGLVHPDSPIKNGSSVRQGATYTVYIVG